MNADRGPACQACGYIPDDEHKAARTVWAMMTYQNFEGGEFHVVICPKCTKLDPPAILTKYQFRIRAGLDLNYH